MLQDKNQFKILTQIHMIQESGKLMYSLQAYVYNALMEFKSKVFLLHSRIYEYDYDYKCKLLTNCNDIHVRDRCFKIFHLSFQYPFI